MKITITSRNKVTIKLKLCNLSIASENVKITMNYCKFDQKPHSSLELEKITLPTHLYQRTAQVVAFGQKIKEKLIIIA